MSSRSQRQDYIARIRYSNELPPPPGPPKSLKMPVYLKAFVSSANLSDLVRKHYVNSQTNDLVDMELGMPLDITARPGIFETGQDNSTYALNPLPALADLDPKDRELLKDLTGPDGSATTNKFAPNVSFLRRTEYISSETVASTVANETIEKIRRRHELEQSKVDPESQLRTIEVTFDRVKDDISTLKHPRKKKITAVESWPFLPDTKMFDLTFLTVRLKGSAVALPPMPNGLPDSRLNTAIFRPVETGDDEWMSSFVTDVKSSSSLKRKLDAITETLDGEINSQDEESGDTYRFKHLKDFDMEVVPDNSKSEEVIITYDKEHNVSKYLPVFGNINLKRRVINNDYKRKIEPFHIAAIDLNLREISAEESIQRDSTRSEFDPVNYAAIEVEENENQNDDNEAEGEVDHNEESS
ncbi:RNA polymerase II-associated [Nadsonia fulvescens var. elongata DSM 6958]|uniref:RNA polymerase II-associated n=1 Tax=Nadsonia fulvescens var. elongata DSM 6958 TaxID=857566 RepID=A0A1E3PQE8_9ASCO|nr:RNA polymerase II-associated [Nadsonia fulvescens var. elongata DSM 6958]